MSRFLLFSHLTVLFLVRNFPPLNFFIDMANTKSALKYIRKTETRTLRNRQVKTRLKTLAKKVQSAVEAKDKDALVGFQRNTSQPLIRLVRLVLSTTTRLRVTKHVVLR